MALVISAIAVSLSWVAVRRAKAAEYRSGLHQDRPAFTAEFEDMGGWHRLALRLEGPIDIRDRVDVDLLAGGLMFRQGIDGVDKGARFPITTAWAQVYTEIEGPPGRTVAPGGMKVGDTVRWMVERVKDPAASTASIRVRAQDARRNWSLLLDVEVPARLQTKNLGIY
ncbi:hypothetical protein [Actinoplanes sp. NPDC051859]|uniref:hypothetical protein n=1 Tax=Actinoplanes sp. NPDC051859 TaxID=3363909 RepID=UPI00379B8A93